MRAIHADPDDTSRPIASKTETFNKNPGAFRATRHQIVGPFEADVGRAEIPCGAHEGYTGDEAELRRERVRAGVDHQGAGVQVAPRRDPGPATAASARGLFVRDDPQPVGVASQRAATRLLVGRIDDAKTNDAPISMRAVQPGDGGQKSDCAAAIAALVIGDGANTKRMIASAETASTMRATAPGRSNAGAGSSKYKSFTILR